MSRAKNGRKGLGRRPLTREMLLPFKPAQVRALSLPAHLALVALRRREGDVAHVRRLAEVIACAIAMSERWAPEIDASVLDEADQVILRLLRGEGQNGHLSVDAVEGAALAHALTIHDQLLERLPCHRYFDALKQVKQAVSQISPDILEDFPMWYHAGVSG